MREDRCVDRADWKEAVLREVGSRVERDVVQAWRLASCFLERGTVVGATSPGKKLTCERDVIALRTIIRSMQSLSPIFLSYIAPKLQASISCSLLVSYLCLWALSCHLLNAALTMNFLIHRDSCNLS